MKDISGLENSFLKFLNERTSQNENIQGCLLSFAQEINGFNFEEKIDSILKSSENSFYFSSAKNQFSFIALNQVFNITENGQARFISTNKKLQELPQKFISNWNGQSLPLFVGALKFTVEHSDDDWKNFSDSSWFIPEITLCKINEKTYLIYNFFSNPNPSAGKQAISKTKLTEQFSRKIESLLQINERNSTTLPRVINSKGFSPKDKKKWRQLTLQALEKINNEEIKKIVIARKIELILSEEINFTGSFKILKNNYPECHSFAYHKGNSTFFGITPETLADISNGKIEADAIAGSIKRGINIEEDKKLESDLMNDKKNLDEHFYVREHMANALSGIGIKIDFSKTPAIKKLKNIQHLFTRISGELTNTASIMGILSELHPTSAVCGFPKEAALSFIKKFENQKRGLYSGIIGWFNLNNEGQFAVSIRSAVTRGNKLIAFAGSGIVEGSDPDIEFEETELKLKPILSLFTEELQQK